MILLRPNVELCSLSILGQLLRSDPVSATTIFANLCGIDLRAGQKAIGFFQSNVKQDARWLDALDRTDAETVRDNPELVISLLVDGFGFYEFDAMGAVLRLRSLAKRERSRVLN